MTELPQGWVETTLGEILYFQYGKGLSSDKRTGGSVAVYGSNGIVGRHNEAITASPTLVIGRKGSIGEVHFSETGCFPIDTTYFVDQFDAVEPRFALTILQGLPLKEMNRASAIPGLNREEAHSLQVSLPPLPEQRRIVRKLDTLSARSTTARTHLTAIEKLVERYKLCFIKEVFAQLAEGHPQSTLSGACLSVTDGDHQAPPKAETGVPFITISAMNAGTIDLSKATRYVPASYFEQLKSERRPQVGDVLYSVTGSIGIPAPVLSPDPFVFQRHIAILRPDPSQMRSEYLRFVLMSPQIFDQAESCATGTAQLTIPLRGLRAFSFPLPSMDEQREIVRRIETAFAKIDRLKAEAAKALKLLGHLESRILAKAFAGDLVPQDPEDEPAETLLARIREARATAPKGKRQRAAAILK